MSAYKPEKGIEAAYIGAPVWWRLLYEDGLNGVGMVFGVVWDTEDNGIIVEFKQDKFTSRYFLNWAAVEKAWKGEILSLTEAQFMGIVPSHELRDIGKVRPLGSIKRNKQRVPVWTQYV
jgi:hypothetical protein